MKKQKVSNGIELFGWLGPIAFVLGFMLISFNVIQARTYTFQALNLIGGLSIVAVSLPKRVWQAVVLNATVALLALFTILQLLLK